MVDTVELNAYGQQFRRFDKGGENVVVKISRIREDGTSTYQELDVIHFDMEDRATNKPKVVVDSIRKALSGDYERRGCQKLGFEWDGNKVTCTDKKAKAEQPAEPQKEAPTKKAPPIRTIIAKRKK